MQGTTSIKKNSSFMDKPVGIMSGTGTTEHPKGNKSTSPRGTLGQSVVGLPNLKVGGGATGTVPLTTNITKVNGGPPGGPQGAVSVSPKGDQHINTTNERIAAADREVDDFLALNFN